MSKKDEKGEDSGAAAQSQEQQEPSNMKQDMLMVLVISVAVAIVGFTVAQFSSSFTTSKPDIVRPKNPNPKGLTPESPYEPPEDNGVIMTADELEKFDGTNSRGDIYLAVIGEIYDVSTGADFYEKGKGYGFFAGRDGSRGFSTGDAGNASDKIIDLDPQGVAGVVGWAMFYRSHENYTYVGKLVGRYYSAEGKPTEEWKKVIQINEEAATQRKLEEEDKKLFPTCNKYWNKKDGTNVWCKDELLKDRKAESKLVPRARMSPFTKKEICVCIEIHVAELDTETFRVYDDCHPKATKCALKN